MVSLGNTEAPDRKQLLAFIETIIIMLLLYTYIETLIPFWFISYNRFPIKRVSIKQKTNKNKKRAKKKMASSLLLTFMDPLCPGLLPFGNQEPHAKKGSPKAKRCPSSQANSLEWGFFVKSVLRHALSPFLRILLHFGIRHKSIDSIFLWGREIIMI